MPPSISRLPAGSRRFRHIVSGVLLAAYLAGCTHTPAGQKAFDNFDQCIAGNLGLAAAGGVAIGALGKALTKQITGDRATQNVVGVAAGTAAAAMIGLNAWRKCAAVYNTSEPVLQTVSTQAPPAAAQRRRPGMSVDRLDVRVEGTENDPPLPEFDFTYIAEDPAAKDIRARFRHKVEIVRFKADDNDRLILADAKGDDMRDASGRPIPLEAAIRMPRERLHWVTIAEEGRDDYVEDVVIQQAQRATYKHKLQVPPRAQLPLPLPVPMRYTLTVETDQSKSSRTVDFALLGTGERPKRFTSGTPADRTQPSAPPAASAPVAPSAPAAEARPAPAAPAGFEPTHKLRRTVPVYSDATANRKQVGRLTKDTQVLIEERGELVVSNRPVAWVKVTTKAGPGGWLPASELVEGR